MTQDQSNGTDKGTSAGGKPDITLMDAAELMKHGGPDLVAEEINRRLACGADPLHAVFGRDPQSKVDAIGARITRELLTPSEDEPKHVTLVFTNCDDPDGEEWIPPFLRAVPPLTSLRDQLKDLAAKGFARGGEVPTPEGGHKAELHGHEKVMPKATPKRLMHEASVKDLLLELESRGGTFAQVAKAQLLVLKKSEDYNRDALDKDGTDSSKRDVYFPFGSTSHAQMIHVKSQRINSLVDAELKGRPVNHEGLKDTALDLINYASFLAEWLERKER
jgi:hypothetical protein